jgi:hypothetical protein
MGRYHGACRDLCKGGVPDGKDRMLRRDHDAVNPEGYQRFVQAAGSRRLCRRRGERRRLPRQLRPDDVAMSPSSPRTRSAVRGERASAFSAWIRA